jgi:CheY-like chemotaxis protein
MGCVIPPYFGTLAKHFSHFLHWISSAKSATLVLGDLRRTAQKLQAENQTLREEFQMAKVLLIGLEQATASQIGRALAVERHQIEHKPKNVAVGDLLDADIVFAGGDGKQYMALLRGLREARPALPFVVVTRIPETSDWLDALEAGATDYCSAPFEARQLNWLMESALPRTNSVAA